MANVTALEFRDSKHFGDVLVRMKIMRRLADNLDPVKTRVLLMLADAHLHQNRVRELGEQHTGNDR